MDFSKIKSLTIPEGNVTQIARNGVVLWSAVEPRIPSAYQEVQWISAAANVGAYINLGFAYDTAATIYLDQWLNGAKTTTYPFGAANSTGVLRCMLTSPDGESAHTSALYGSNGVNYGSSSVSNNVTNGKNEFVMTIGANVRKLQNRTTGVTSSGAVSQTAYTMTDNLYLFAQNYKGSPRFGGERKISAFKYYDKTNTLICDLVPCYRKSDNVIGMYDIVRATFLTNVGSGSFTKGADVPTSGGIPEYHFIESARLVDTIRTFKTAHSNSLIFGAVSDIHVYNANTTYEARSKTAIKNAAFALEMVGAMAECDFIANLGDNCWENGLDTDNALLGANYSINALKPVFDRLTSFNLVGNHDKSDYTETQYNLIGLHNDFDVASSTVIRGFGYKDYTDKKVRIIVLNTCDYLNASGGCALSYEQKDFLMRALDLSAKSNYADWQILLLSHIPLDWNGGDYNYFTDLQAILKAYEDGTTASITVNSSYALNETPSNYATYTGGKLVYNYSGKNSAKIIANIHGHVHTNKVSKVANTNIARVATANTNPDLNKSESYPTYGDYSITSTEAAKIVKVSGTAKDTSATFYCIDLDEQTIYAYGYGADIDRTVIYDSATVYSITYNRTNCTISNMAAEIAENRAYTTTIAPIEDAVLDSVTVTMGGTDITSSAYKDGVINIANVTGDIVITATASVPLWTETISDIAVAIRSLWQMSSGSVILSNSNTEAAIGVATANSYVYTDRESKKVYLMPVKAKACDAEVAVTDGTACTYRFIGLKSASGKFTQVFDTGKKDATKYSWTAGAIDYILINLERKDGASWAWGYDDTKIKVTFTNGGTASGGGGGNTPTYTNIIDTVGTVDNVRLRSGGATGSAAGFASNYFPAKGGDIIRVYFPNGNRASIPSNGVYCCTYSNTSGTLVTAYDGSTSSTVLKNATETGYEIHIPTSVNCSYARVAGGPNGAYSGWVVTVNEEIT